MFDLKAHTITKQSAGVRGKKSYRQCARFILMSLCQTGADSALTRS